ncbi:sensor histidine kinase [Companilactobacillus kedongensis]|uniref:sensor histidine kinase n=1 Tax=Companilactobacillus kedongensis TaxID=2486004 RepID=UPI000F7B547F|nr:HAMP domain-containing sensor histidine kinase [Companilactobacillus kedongensis]
MNKKIKLSSKEKGVLLAEGIGTFLLFQIVNIILIVMSELFYNHQNFSDINSVIAVLKSDLTHSTFWGIWFFLAVVILIELAVSVNVAVKSYQQYEVNKVEKQLEIIAAGKLDQRIDFKVNKKLQGVVNSINLLISNTDEHIEEQKRSEKSKDELITNVSHDIRTPLTSIIGYLGLIESQNYQDIEQILKYTHVAYKKSLEMQNLVNSLFEYANVQHATSKLNATHFDMVQMLEQLSADFELEAKKRNIKINVVSEPKKIMMNGDTEKLGRTFNNLITNAFKYGAGATDLYLEAKQEKSGVVVTIANNGRQIPKKSLPNLFDRFYRVEDSRSKKTGGTGLGLAIAKSMIEMHGGTITAASDEKLTSFTIHFPLTSEE